MRIRARNLARELMAEGVQLRGKAAIEGSRCCGTLQESLDAGRQGLPGGLRSEDFSIRDLMANLCFSRDGTPAGEGFIQEYFHPSRPDSLQEAMAAVDSSAFLGITGQIVVNKVLQKYEQEEFVATKQVPEVSTALSGERFPGIGMPQDPGEDVTLQREQEPLRYVGLSEEYIETPATDKHALGIAVTKEAIFFDRTGVILQRANSVGEILGLQKEKRILGAMIGADNTYREKRRTDTIPVDLKTFYSAVDAGRWTNHFDGNTLADWTNIDYAEQRFAETVDPGTGEPIIMGGRFLLAPAQKAMTMQQILTATQLWRLTAGLGGAGINTISPNVLAPMGLRFALSRQLTAQLVARLGVSAADARDYWFYGDAAKAFAYMVNWPITVVQAPLNSSEAEFSQDIVVRFKASERGKIAIVEPRCWQRHRTLATSSSSGA